MILKKTSAKILTFSLYGYIFVHPLIMLVSYFMSDTLHFNEVKILPEILKSFSFHMLPWGISFAILGGVIGFYYDKNKRTSEENLKLILQLKQSLSDEVKAAEDRKYLILNLNKALDEVNTLRGILPICSYCKKIKDGSDVWQKLEKYIFEHSDATFSHGICPDCAKKYYPDIDIG